MKVKMLEIFKNKRALMQCKWSSLNALGTENPLSHSVLELGEFPFPLLALWGNKNGLPSMKVKKLEKFHKEMGLKPCKWSSMNAQSTGNPLSHSVLGL